MTKTYFLLIAVVIFALFSPVSAVMISGATWYDTMHPGQTITHSVHLLNQNNETGLVLSVGTDSPNWMTVSKPSVTIGTEQIVNFTVLVPMNATNGNYTARMTLTAKAVGMTQSQMTVPEHVFVQGGSEPVPTIATTIPTTTATIAIETPLVKVTERIPLTQNVQPVETTPAVRNATGTAAPYDSGMSTMILAMGILAGLALIVWAVSKRQSTGKKRVDYVR